MSRLGLAFAAYRKCTTTSLKLWLRDRQALFWTLAFPLVFAISFGVFFSRLPAQIRWPIVLRIVAINVVAMGLFSLPTQLVTWRERGVLRRYLVTPLPPAILLLAEATAFLLIGSLSILLQLLLLTAVLKPGSVQNISLALPILAGGALTALGLGLIVAAVVPSPKLVPAIGQTLFLPMMFLSGATIPAEMLPRWLRTAGEYNPLGVMVRAIDATGETPPSVPEVVLAVLALTTAAVLALLLAIRVFRWDPFTALRPSQWIASATLLGALLATPRLLRSLIALTLLPTGTVYVHAGHIWDGQSNRLRGPVTIVIHNGIIRRVADGFLPPPRTARHIDARHLTVLPGLGDAHVHLSAIGLFFGGAFTQEPHKLMERNLRRNLQCGVTMVKSCGDPLGVILAVRDRLRTGFAHGPALRLVGPLFTAPNGHPAQYAAFLTDKRQFVRELASAADVEAALDDCLGEVDSIKAVYAGGISPFFSYERLDRAALAKLIRQAHAYGLKITVHVDTPEELRTAVELGADGIEHVPVTDIVPSSTWKRMARRGVILVPTLAVYEGYRLMSDPEAILMEPFVPTVLSDDEQNLLRQPFARLAATLIPGAARAAMVRTAQQNTLAAYRAGVPIVAGSDAGNPGTFHGAALHRELRLLTAAGLPPLEALKAATSRCGAWLNLPNGRIAAGYAADLIAIDGDPLKKLTALNQLRWVMRLGRIESPSH